MKKGKKENGEVRIREAGEKAWNAVVQATNGLFEKLGETVPKSHFERRKGLFKLEESNSGVKEKGFLDRYTAREQTPHEYCFYEGIYSLSRLEEAIKKVKQYIEDVERL